MIHPGLLKAAGIGAGVGAAWGLVSDDTSVIGGAMMGAGLGAGVKHFGPSAAAAWKTAAAEGKGFIGRAAATGGTVAGMGRQTYTAGKAAAEKMSQQARATAEQAFKETGVGGTRTTSRAASPMYGPGRRELVQGRIQASQQARTGRALAKEDQMFNHRWQREQYAKRMSNKQAGAARYRSGATARSARGFTSGQMSTVASRARARTQTQVTQRRQSVNRALGAGPRFM